MLEGVDRLINLAPGLADASVTAAVSAGDVDALARTDHHFAAVGRQGHTVRLARTIAVPLRYFVAKMYHGPFLIVAERIDHIAAWCEAHGIGWQFDPAYTRMVPAHYLVEIDQVGCPDPNPRYHRFFTPTVATGPADIEAAGAAYIGAAYAAVERWIAALPGEARVGVEFSGGIDSTAVWLLARYAARTLGRDPDAITACTLDLGGGADAAQAASAVAALGLESQWERLSASRDDYDAAAAILAIEDYHPLDVECAAAGLCLARAMRRRHPSLRYVLDGDGGDENLKAYPLEDSDLTLSSVLRNPLLYHEGWGIDAVKHSLTYSGGLSRGYVRTHAPAKLHGFEAFSPFTVRSVIAAALALPFEQMLGGDAGRLATLKGDVVRAGVRAVTGIEMPLHPKRRFQDGVAGSRTPVTKAWCRRTFDRYWETRLAASDAALRRSGNEMTV